MKNLINSTILLLFSSIVQGQSLNYCAIERGNFFIGLREKDGYWTDIIRMSDLNKKSYPEITYTGILLDDSSFPYCWKHYRDRVVLIEAYRNVVLLKNYPLEYRDSLVIKQYYDSLKVELTKRYPNQDEFEEANLQIAFKEAAKIEENVILPATSFIRQQYQSQVSRYNKAGELSYDFIPVNHKLFMFYIRTDDEFTVWKFHYPPLGEESEATNWDEVITYSSDSTYSPLVKRRDSDVLPSGEKHVFNAIQDTSFFNGHFKAIMQEKHLFLINIEHGGIYLVSDKSIDKIGQLKDLESYPTWIFNKKVFIEDKDNKRLIFFSEVEQLRKDLPFPNLLIIKEEQAFKKYFPYIP